MRFQLWFWWTALAGRLHPCPLCGRWRGKPHPMCSLAIEEAMAKAGVLDRPYVEP